MHNGSVHLWLHYEVDYSLFIQKLYVLVAVYWALNLCTHQNREVCAR